MTRLGIRYLTGRSVATNVKRDGGEWPPHVGRIFMAMAAAYFETGGDPAERTALEWLEQQEPPRVSASECHQRDLVGVYVPVNDRLTFPQQKQERTFASVRPHSDSVFLTWKEDAPPEIRQSLETLCAKVTRIGHSASLAQMWLADENDEALDVQEGEWVPEESMGSGVQRMRVAAVGGIASFERDFNAEARAHYADLSEQLQQATGRARAQLGVSINTQFPDGAPASQRPKMGRWAGYVKRDKEENSQVKPLKGLFDADSMIVLGQKSGHRLGLESILPLAAALRNAAMRAAGQSVPEWLSGHAADGSVTKMPHMAFFPLPFVGSEHADGRVVGVAMAAPRGIDKQTDFRRVMGALLFSDKGEDKPVCLWGRTADGRGERTWELELERSSGYEPRLALRAKSWTKASTLWASVTPVVLHHYPKKNREDDVAEIVTEAFVSAGLPRPRTVATMPVSYWQGAGHIRAVPPFSEGGEALCRYQTHIVAEFDVPVEGPVLVGRGRFRGYGLCKPIVRKEDDARSDGE